MMKKEPTKGEKRAALLKAAKEAYVPLMHAEFSCPRCKGVASVYVQNGQMTAECHACGHKVVETGR